MFHRTAGDRVDVPSIRPEQARSRYNHNFHHRTPGLFLACHHDLVDDQSALFELMARHDVRGLFAALDVSRVRLDGLVHGIRLGLNLYIGK
jgi:hypothetical protein